MYSLKAILQKQPAVIAGAVRTVLYVLVLASVLHWDSNLLAGVALALEVILSLFVYSNSTSTSFPTLEKNTVVKVAGTSDKVRINTTPPGPTGIDTQAGSST